MCAAVKPDGTKYYEYALCYVDDTMVISTDPDKIIEVLREHFVLKEVSNPGELRQHYLGAILGKYSFKDGLTGWYMSAEEYLAQAIPTVEAEWDEKLYKKASLLLSNDYHPEMGTLPLLSVDDALLYGSYIGIL